MPRVSLLTKSTSNTRMDPLEIYKSTRVGNSAVCFTGVVSYVVYGTWNFLVSLSVCTSCLYLAVGQL